MDSLTEIIKTLSGLSSTGVLALAIFAVIYYFKYIKKAADGTVEKPTSVEDMLTKISNNHLHTIQETLDRIERKNDESNRRQEEALTKIVTLLEKK